MEYVQSLQFHFCDIIKLKRIVGNMGEFRFDSLLVLFYKMKEVPIKLVH
jgi:hypothetical protein